jgi:hypothetical protein
MTWFISKPTSAEDSDTPQAPDYPPNTTQTRTRLSAGLTGHNPPPTRTPAPA